MAGWRRPPVPPSASDSALPRICAIWAFRNIDPSIPRTGELSDDSEFYGAPQAGFAGFAGFAGNAGFAGFGLPESPVAAEALITNRDGIVWVPLPGIGPVARGVITLAIHPTASLHAGAALAPSGLWQIAIEKANAAMDPAQQVEIWIRRDETLPGYRPGGRQAFFANPCYQRFGPFGRLLAVDAPDTDCPVRRAGTLSGFACSAEPMVIAAFTRSDHALSDYSAAGPVTHTRHTPEPWRGGPDAAALGDDTLVLRGVLSAGTRSGSYVRMNGTSVAAPRVARLAVEDIGGTDLTARDWLKTVVAAHPFRMDPEPAEKRLRDGGIAIPVDLGRWRVLGGS